MKISELIGLLQAMQKEQGDLEVEGLDINGYSRPINPPKLAYWHSFNSVDRRGDTVCRLD